MNVIFYNRNFTGTLAFSRVSVSVLRYSHTMIGGPDTAYLRIQTSGDNWELTKLLRCPVEIYDGDGNLNWWGYVNRVTVPHGDIKIGMGMDNLSNRVAANYSVMDSGSTSPTAQTVTDWVSDTTSIQEYGQKEKLLTINNATAAQAEAARSTYLQANKYAPPEVELSGGETDYVSVECYGWFRTLEWKYYSNSTASNTATTSQISAIVTSAGQFFNGSLIENVSGIDSNQYRDGTGNALRYISELMNAGTSNNRPLLAKVDKDRYLHVYERQAENPQYMMRKDGQLETLLGQLVRPSHCICAAWVRIRDIPDMLGGMSAMRNFFIESVEYDAERDRAIYRPAGAFEAVRLARYLGLDDSGVNGSGGSFGGSGFTMPFHTHPSSSDTVAIEAYADVGWHNNSFDTLAVNVVVYSTSRSAGAGSIKLDGMEPGKYFVIANATNYIGLTGSTGAIINGLLTIAVTPTTYAWADSSGVVSSVGNARVAATASCIVTISSTSDIIEAGWQAGVLDGSCTFSNPYEFAVQVIRVA